MAVYAPKAGWYVDANGDPDYLDAGDQLIGFAPFIYNIPEYLHEQELAELQKQLERARKKIEDAPHNGCDVWSLGDAGCHCWKADQ